jgi:hypothetical protein
MLLMSVPDEIAQYAERARIAAWFVVGDTVDRAGASHPAYLWAAAARPGNDFDSLRLFSWNTRRNRYETSYIERNLQGFLPILIVRRPTGEASGFSAVVVEKDGALKTREYSINGFRVRLAGRRPPTVPKRWSNPDTGAGEPQVPESTAAPNPSWRDRLPSWMPFATPQSSR